MTDTATDFVQALHELGSELTRLAGVEWGIAVAEFWSELEREYGERLEALEDALEAVGFRVEDIHDWLEEAAP